MNHIEVAAATDLVEQLIREQERTSLMHVEADRADYYVAVLGTTFVRMLEEHGHEAPEAGYAVAHEFVSRRLREEADAEAEFEAAITEAEARARWNAACDAELDNNARDYATYGYIDN